MTSRPPLPLADYQRIYQVAYSVLEASGIATTHRACLFFASVGTLILREHYRKQATFSAGGMAVMIDEKNANVVVYGREENGRWIHDANGFHAWVECDGWLIDFMAPVMGDALREDGVTFAVPRKMLQKRLEDRCPEPHAIQHEGEFFCASDHALAQSLLDEQGTEFSDLVHICLTWFRKPPKPLASVALGATDSTSKPITLRAPAIEGVW